VLSDTPVEQQRKKTKHEVIMQRDETSDTTTSTSTSIVTTIQTSSATSNQQNLDSFVWLSDNLLNNTTIPVTSSSSHQLHHHSTSSNRFIQLSEILNSEDLSQEVKQLFVDQYNNDESNKGQSPDSKRLSK
jgi:hypothetical protein